MHHSDGSNHSRRQRALQNGVFMVLGSVFGLATFTFVYAEGGSYLSDDPAACINCHVMRPQFEGWQHASHRQVATCNDCHTPHGPVSKWAVKALHGWNHSVAFTTGKFVEPVRIHDLSARIVQDNCESCHASLVDALHTDSPSSPVLCAACHTRAGH
jgi:cytochrome c nitrite reductase small subunit